MPERGVAPPHPRFWVGGTAWCALRSVEGWILKSNILFKIINLLNLDIQPTLTICWNLLAPN